MIFPKDLPSPRAQLALSVFLEVAAAGQLTSHDVCESSVSLSLHSCMLSTATEVKYASSKAS